MGICMGEFVDLICCIACEWTWQGTGFILSEYIEIVQMNVVPFKLSLENLYAIPKLLPRI